MDKDIYYDSWKEDRDLILEYNQVSLADARISNILGMGVDNLTSTQAIAKVMKMIEEDGFHHIIPLNPYKLIRFRSNNDLNITFNKSSMRFASGAGLGWPSSLLAFPLRERIPLISFIMELIRLAETKEYTIFIVGGRSEVAEKAFFNIRKSFPKIRIVGRHGGYFNETREKSVVEAIRKSEADIVLVGMGFPKEDKWVAKYRSQFSNSDSVFISVGGSLDIIAGEHRKAPNFFIERGLVWFYRVISRPWRYGRIFRLFLFYLHVIIKKIFSRR
jgi:N-acetylglucosaminyldiphosphoundecaprenol N-acetyl-beta-D-mannosaminyltransferase